MANTNNPQGLLPMEGLYGGAPSFELTQANILYNNTTAIFRGDIVVRNASGYINGWIQDTSAVGNICGVFWGVEYLSTSQGKMISNSYWPGSDVASTAQATIVAKIIPVGDMAAPMKFRVQSDATGLTIGNVGQIAKFNVGTGNTLTGQSGGYISDVSSSTSATLPIRIIGLYGGAPGAGGRMGIQNGSAGPYSGSATGAYAQAIVYIDPFVAINGGV